ncbi:hypothetical protein [Streptomyces collinus]|uniref:hypothetical protein n=1 Tax=Streptomyces collinus TaxID=42684 RepID=UPI0033D7BB60
MSAAYATFGLAPATRRFVIFGCPECADLGCGAVTAVLERDGDDRVLLIGARVAVLARLAAAPRAVGVGVDIAQDARGVPAEELRGYGAVAFARAVGEAERAPVRAAFERAGLEVAQVDGLAPIVPLLVARIEHALDRGPLARRRLTGLVAAGGAAGVDVTSPCRVRLTAYRLDRLSRTRTHEVFDGVLEPGHHRVPLDPGAVKGESYMVARTSGSVPVRPVERPAGRRTPAPAGRRPPRTLGSAS